VISFENTSIFRPAKTEKDGLLLNQLTVDVQKGKGLGVVGPNGSGKSTLLKSALGILDVSHGLVRINNKVKVGYMPQNYRSGVLSWLTLDQHFEHTLHSKEIELAKSFLTDTGFAPDGNRKLANMSGGEIQITILSTLIAQNCGLLLLDEPLSAIDFVRRKKTLSRLKSEMSNHGRTVVMISHQLADARFLCDKILVISGGNDGSFKILNAGDKIDLMKMF